MSDPLRGAVAALLTNRELVINLGTEQGVTEGMRFAVLNSHGVDIHDPETSEVLGSVDVPKVIVEAVRIEPRLTVARTFNKRRRNVGGSGGVSTLALSGLFEPPKWVEEWETLRTTEKPQIKELPEEDSYVKIGDPVVEVRNEEYVTEDS